MAQQEDGDLAEFQARAVAALLDAGLKSELVDHRRYIENGRPFFSSGYDGFEPKNPFFGIRVSWCVGGASGGHYDTQAEPWASDETPTDLQGIDAILGDLYPEVSFKVGRRLMAKVEQGTYSENEVYGNHVTYAYRRLSLQAMKDWADEEGLVMAPPAEQGFKP